MVEGNSTARDSTNSSTQIDTLTNPSDSLKFPYIKPGLQREIEISRLSGLRDLSKNDFVKEAPLDEEETPASATILARDKISFRKRVPSISDIDQKYQLKLPQITNTSTGLQNTLIQRHNKFKSKIEEFKSTKVEPKTPDFVRLPNKLKS